MKINSCLAFALFLLLVSCALAAETTTQEAKGARDDVEPAYNRGGGGGCQGRNCGGGGGCHGHNCGGGGGGCQGRNCGGGGGYHCRHGCCKYYGGQCKDCCPSAAAARAFAEKQGHP